MVDPQKIDHHGKRVYYLLESISLKNGYKIFCLLKFYVVYIYNKEQTNKERRTNLILEQT